MVGPRYPGKPHVLIGFFFKVSVKKEALSEVTGYAFKLKSGYKVATEGRRPYIKGVSVITKGSVTSASDPRGFNQGDAPTQNGGGHRQVLHRDLRVRARRPVGGGPGDIWGNSP